MAVGLNKDGKLVGGPGFERERELRCAESDRAASTDRVALANPPLMGSQRHQLAMLEENRKEMEQAREREDIDREDLRRVSTEELERRVLARRLSDNYREGLDRQVQWARTMWLESGRGDGEEWEAYKAALGRLLAWPA